MLGLGIVALAVSVGGCRQKAKTPLDAYTRLTAAVTSGNGGALFDVLDQETRWNWMSIQKFHREAYDIVLSNYPEGEVRERETRRLNLLLVALGLVLRALQLPGTRSWRMAVARPSSPASTSTALSHGSSSEVS